MYQICKLTGKQIMTYVAIINGNPASHARATPSTLPKPRRNILMYCFTGTVLMMMEKSGKCCTRTGIVVALLVGITLVQKRSSLAQNSSECHPYFAVWFRCLPTRRAWECIARMEFDVTEQCFWVRYPAPQVKPSENNWCTSTIFRVVMGDLRVKPTLCRTGRWIDQSVNRVPSSTTILFSLLR